MKKTIALLFLLAWTSIGLADNHDDAADGCQASPSCVMQVNAWEALGDERYEDALEITAACTEQFGAAAKETHASMSGPVVAKNELEYWVQYGVLTDVAACYFIRADALTKLDRADEALVAYRVLAEELNYSQLWDPRGWFWKPADVAETRIAEIEGG